MKSLPSYFVLAVLICFSCQAKPSPIDYGKDQCSFCKMIISDKRFGAELVSTKGKIFKFDALECLIPTMQSQGGDYFAFKLVTDYNRPGEFINAEEASFLICPEIPSPMGANLSSYSNNTEAKAMQQKHKAVLLDWEDLSSRNFNLPND